MNHTPITRTIVRALAAVGIVLSLIVAGGATSANAGDFHITKVPTSVGK